MQQTSNERLLSARETMERFNMKHSAFYHYLPRLKAWGLQAVGLGKKGQKFREVSVDKCIRQMAEKEIVL